jgi:hypothetical protein
VIGQPYKSPRHAGTSTGRPDYTYTGRHEAPLTAGCPAVTYVHGGDGEDLGMLVCNRPGHPGDTQHYDQADGILWSTIETSEPAAPDLAGAVA